MCGFCATGSERSVGIHLPSNFDDRAKSSDGKVFVAKCDECDLFTSDVAAAEQVEKVMGWKWRKSYDRDDARDVAERAKKAGTEYYRPYFVITLKEALEFAVK